MPKPNYKSQSNKPTKNGGEDEKQTKQKHDDAMICSYWNHKFKESMVHKSKETSEWKDYWDAYTGDYFTDTSKPGYKSHQVSNFVFSTIETIRPTMVDNNPRFLALARTAEGEAKNDKVQISLDYEFDRENMPEKIPRQTIVTLVLGTSIYFLPWDGSDDKNGNVKAIEVNPFNIFPDPLATSVDDSEYMIYATYKHENQLKKMFPNKSNLLEGGNIKYKELVANGEGGNVSVDNQILVLEIWCRDYTSIEYEEERDGEKVHIKKSKYPRGRVITIAPEIDVVLSDKQNPYDDGKFPFVLIKDYDIPFKFWGEGEPKQLLSPQEYINDLSNQVIDNAKLTANMPWIVDKNSGIGYGQLTNRPGLVVRKNPGTEVKRDAPPPMPAYVQQKVEELKLDIETISGIHDVTAGKRPTGIQAGNAIMALQEAGQARIRLKIKLMEQGLGRLATMWYDRMQQFWKLDRWVRVTDSNGETRTDKITQEDLANDYDVKITTGSTMPTNKASMLDLLIRLGQTQAEDGMPMVDRDSILEYVPLKDKQRVLKKFEALRGENEQKEQQMLQREEQMAMQEQQAQVQQSQEQAKAQQGQQMQQQGEGDGQVIEQITVALDNMSKAIEELQMQVNELKGSQPGMAQGNPQMEQPQASQPVDIDAQQELPDEVLNEIAQLSDEELVQLLQEKPELQQILANNLPK